MNSGEKKIENENSPFSIPHSPQRGVSLLELLIYVAILSVLVVIVANAFISLAKGRGQSEARSEVNSAVRFANQVIKQDIKNAQTVTTPLLGTPASTLSVTVSGNIVMYDVVGGVLRRTVNAGTPEPINGSSVWAEMPVFTRFENYNSILNATTTAVLIEMTMRYNASSTDWTYSDTSRTTITLR